MKRQPARGLPIGPILAIIGGAIGVASLTMQWFVFNMAGLQSAIQNVGTSQYAKDQLTQHQPIDHLQTTMVSTLTQITPQYAGHLKGFQVLSHVSFLIEAGAAGLAILVGVLGLIGLLNKRGILLFLCAIGLFARPFYALVMPPADSTLSQIGFENAHLLNPATGLWLSIVAGTVVLAATFGLTARAAVQYDVPVGKYGDSGPFVPNVDTSAASSQSAYSGGAASAGSYGAGAFVPGVGGAMNSSPPSFGSTPAVYGADPIRPANPAGGQGGVPGVPGASGARRSAGPPPKF